MQIQASGASFYPLFWVHHDCWQIFYRVPNTQGPPTITKYDHPGHMHFFLMGYNWDDSSQDAWGGKQTYNFSAVDLWGPRSQDPNQQFQYRVVGTPKWYFNIQELWRRVYIHPWDLKIDSANPWMRRGVKYDCCAPDKIFGPFREGRDYSSRRSFAPAFARYGRTIPPDYFLTSSLSQVNTVDRYIRGGQANTSEDPSMWYADVTPSGGPVLGPFSNTADANNAADVWLSNNTHTAPVTNRTNHLGDLAASMLTVGAAGTNPAYNPKTFNPQSYDLQHGNYLFAGGDGTPPHPASKQFSDMLYAWPLVEYQTVTQLNWERLPGATAHDVDANNFGDGWNVSVELPLRMPDSQLYRSPFCPPNTKTVMPIGNYYNDLVTPGNQFKYQQVSYDDPAHPPYPGPGFYYDTPEKLNPSLSGQPLSFRNPYQALGIDLGGRWVQMFMGGIVQARCEVTLEHKLGGRMTVWINSTQYSPTTPFAGRDQGTPAS